MEGLPIQPEKKYEVRKDPQNVFEGYLKVLNLKTEDLKFPLLDVGANTGGFVTYCRENLGHEDCYGVEPSEPRRGEVVGLVAGTAQNIPFPDETFEMVISKNVVPMFNSNSEKNKQSIEEMLRVLKKGGVLVFDYKTQASVERYFAQRPKDYVLHKNDEAILEEERKGAVWFVEYLEDLRKTVKSIELEIDGLAKIEK